MNTNRPRGRSQTLPAAFSLGLLTLLLACLFVPAASAAPRPTCHDVQATVTEFAVAVSAAQKTAPHTDGATVVWSDDRGGAAAIYSYDLGAQSESLVADASGDLAAPTVSAGAVFWTDLSAADPMVAGLDPSLTPPQIAVGTDPGEQPAVDGGYVVFTDVAGGASHIYGYNRETQQVFPICVATGAQSHPAISGNLVVWQDDRNGKWDIYGCNLTQLAGSGAGSSGSAARKLAGRRVGCGLPAEFAVCTSAGNHTDPAIYGDVCVWQDDRNGDSDIYGCDLSRLADEGGAQSAAAAPAGAARLGCDDSPEFAVCTADGDQTDPTVSGGLVAWQDDRDGTSHIYGYDLFSGTEFPICTAEGAQTSPSAGTQTCVSGSGQTSSSAGNQTCEPAGGQYTVVWLDGRNGGSDVYGANVDFGDVTPPPTEVWTSSSVVNLLLSAFQGLGVFDEWNYSLDGGTTWAADGWLTLDASSTITLPSGDGPKTVDLKFADSASGTVIGPIEFTVWVDTEHPVTRALARTVVTRGHTAALRMMVREHLSPKANVTVVVRNLRGKTVKTIRLGKRPTNKLLVARFHCTLRRGTYRYRVLASDLAGNHQAKVGSNLLIVR